MTELVIGAIIAGIILLYFSEEETLEDMARRKEKKNKGRQRKCQR